MGVGRGRGEMGGQNACGSILPTWLSQRQCYTLHARRDATLPVILPESYNSVKYIDITAYREGKGLVREVSDLPSDAQQEIRPDLPASMCSVSLFHLIL